MVGFVLVYQSGTGWRAGAESGKNQFSSRQSVTVNGDAYPIPGVHFQETSLLTHQQLNANAPITHHQRFTDVVPDQRNIPATSNLTQQPTSSHQRNIHVHVHGQGVNTSSNAYLLPAVGGSHAWAGQESPHSSTNYNAYGTREVGPGPGPSWGRNSNSNSGGYHPRGFDSWSPEDSPVRSREYDEKEREDHSRRSYGYNYNNNMLRMQNDHFRFRDRGGGGGGRNEASRWRDRRR